MIAKMNNVIRLYNEEGFVSFVQRIGRQYGTKLALFLLSPLRVVAPYTYTKVFRFIKGYNRHLDQLVSGQVQIILENRSAKEAKGPALFVDCGVNEGFVLSRYIKNLSNDFKFIGFEIQNNLIALARKNNPGADIRNQAISDSAGEIEIYLPKKFGMNFRGGASIVSSKISQQNLQGVLKCEAIRFVDFLRTIITDQGYQFVVVKMDIEGAEYRVLDDLYRSWKESGSVLIDYLMIEFHPKTLDNPDQQVRYECMLDEMGINYSTWI